MKTSKIQQANPEGDAKERLTLLLNERTGDIRVSKEKRRVKRKVKWDTWFYVGFVGEIGYAIALPVVGGGLAGGYIDRQLSTYPKATLLLLFVGIVISFLGFVRTIQELLHRKN
jgi:predicted F0F1-ATPase subunit